jgi:hypothetical protein
MSATFRLGHQHIFVFDTTPLLQAQEQGISIQERNCMRLLAPIGLFRQKKIALRTFFLARRASCKKVAHHFEREQDELRWELELVPQSAPICMPNETKRKKLTTTTTTTMRISVLSQSQQPTSPTATIHNNTLKLFNNVRFQFFWLFNNNEIIIISESPPPQRKNAQHRHNRLLLLLSDLV